MERFDRVVLEAPAIEEITADPLQRELAKEARRVLGYGLFEEHLQGGVAAEVKKRAENAKLVQVFSQLDIQPLDPDQVQRYQKKERRALNRKDFFALPWYVQPYVVVTALLNWISTYVPDPNQSRWGDAFLVGTFLGALFAVVGAVFAAPYDAWVWWVVGALSPCALFWIAFLSCAWILDKGWLEDYTHKVWTWAKLSFAECHERKIEIPPFALDTAVRIKKLLPEASIYVEAVVSTEYSLGDPFLCVEYGGGKHYVEVWEESAFEKQTTRKS